MSSEATEILERWRQVERALTEVNPGSSYAVALEAEAIRLRDEYQRMLLAASDAPDRAHVDSRPEP